MKALVTTIVAILFSGALWGQEGSKVKDLEEISATVGAEIQKDTLTKRSKEDEIKELIQKVIDSNKDQKIAIGEIKLKNRTIVFDDEIVSKLKKNTNKDVNGILHDLYLKFIAKEKTDNKQYKTLTIKVNNDTVSYVTPVVKIDSVKFDIQEGMLEFVKVYLNDGTTYTNKKAPIAIIYFEKRGNDRLYNADGNKFVLLKDIATFDTDKRFGYLPDNKRFSIENKNDSIPGKLSLSRNSDINSLVNFTAYSDLLGLLGDEPNALVNFEASAKFYLHRLNIPESYVYLFPTFQPHFHYNRVDSKFDSIVVENNNINPTEIFRRYNFAVGFDVTAFRWDWRPANSFELKAGYLYTSSKVYIDDQRTNAINHVKHIEVNLKSKVIDNFGIDISARYIWQKLNENTFFDRSREEMAAFRGGIYYASDKAKGDDKIFLRFTNYLVLGDREKDFSQIQVGFTKSLSF